MRKISSGRADSLKSRYVDKLTLVQCQTKPGEGTDCKVNGKEIAGGLVKAIEEGKKVSKREGVKAYFQNTSLDIFCTLEEFIKSCPKVAEEIELNEKIQWVKISAILIVGIAFLIYLWITI